MELRQIGGIGAPLTMNANLFHTWLKDERQFEMEFTQLAELSIGVPSADDIGQVEEVLGDLDRLEEQIPRI